MQALEAQAGRHSTHGAPKSGCHKPAAQDGSAATRWQPAVAAEAGLQGVHWHGSGSMLRMRTYAWPVVLPGVGHPQHRLLVNQRIRPAPPACKGGHGGRER
jgi:hypothetical protein